MKNKFLESISGPSIEYKIFSKYLRRVLLGETSESRPLEDKKDDLTKRVFSRHIN